MIDENHPIAWVVNVNSSLDEDARRQTCDRSRESLLRTATDQKDNRLMEFRHICSSRIISPSAPSILTLLSL